MFFVNKEKLFELSKDKPLKVAICGEWKGHDNGHFKVSLEDLNSMIEHFKKQGIEIVIDYEHQSLKNEKAPAAGWIKELYLEGESLMAKAEFNEEARGYIERKQYRYLSPVFEFNTKDNQSGELVRAKLHSVALTNTPFLAELGEIIANANKVGHTQALNTNILKGENMDTKIKDLEALIEALKKQNEELLAQNEALKKQNEEGAKELASSLVDGAIEAKKIANTQKEWALAYACKDIAGFKSFLESLNTQTQTPPQNNMFANKNETSNQEVDVVKFMLGE